jgi:hypothetical protein
VEIDELGAHATMDRLPFEVRWPTQRALQLWRNGELDAAKSNLEIAHAATRQLHDELGTFHVLHLRACVAYSERDFVQARRLHNEVLGLCHEIEFLGGMGSSLCDLAMIDLAEGDVDGAFVRYERGLACFEEGGYVEHAARARELWESAAQAS